MAGETEFAAKRQAWRPDTQRSEPAFGSPAEPSVINAAERNKPLEILQTFQTPGNTHSMQAGRAGAVMTVRRRCPRSWRSHG